jgi:maltose 6'-phosphate phosphatase
MKHLLALCAVLIMLVGSTPARAGQASCEDVMQRGHLNVLTINILYTDFFQRMERLRAVADFIQAQEQAGEPVDIILLQEVVSGAIAGTVSLSINLSAMLRRQGLDYNLRFRPVAGLPGVFMVGNAMLSRCAISGFASRLLPYAPERPVAEIGLPVLHEVQRIAIDVPDYGTASVYNTHLCAYCPGEDRLRQTKSLFRFLDAREDNESRLVVLGGDFNTDVTVPADLPTYTLITDDNGFTDTYAEASSCTDCCSDAEGLDGCTYAVPGNTLAAGAPPVRIDYIFARGDGFAIRESRVVFNQAPWVSDHSGVFSSIGLQP